MLEVYRVGYRWGLRPGVPIAPPAVAAGYRLIAQEESCIRVCSVARVGVGRNCDANCRRLLVVANNTAAAVAVIRSGLSCNKRLAPMWREVSLLIGPTAQVVRNINSGRGLERYGGELFILRHFSLQMMETTV